MKTTSNPLTAQQNRRLYWILGQLGVKDKDAIAEIVWDHTNHRTHHTSELEFFECMELLKRLECLYRQKRKTTSERTDDYGTDTERARLDRKRKGLIKAIFRWYELQGKTVAMEYVKGTACRAAGVNYFNEISESALTRLYAEFCSKQRAVSTKNELYNPFCMN